MKNIDRRQFITLSTKVFSATCISSVALVKTLADQLILSDDQELRRRSARYVMTFASPYASKDRAVSPHMHQELKQNIETLTQGKVFVDIIDQGRGGVGTDLMADVHRGRKTAALVSVSNLTPIAKELNVLNIPFWVNDQQSYLNLVTSKTLDDLVFEKVRASSNIDALFWYMPGFRTFTSTRSYNRVIKTPQDIKDVNYRVPPSETLRQFCMMAGARPRKVPWKQVYRAAEQNDIQAMDPSILGLYSGPNGLRNHIHSISRFDTVYDGWIAVINQQWLQSLDSLTREQLKEAADMTMKQHLTRIVEVEKFCLEAFGRLNVEIYKPTADERNVWKDICGYERKEWDPVKKKLLGSLGAFDRLLDATQHDNGFTFPI